MAGKSKVIYLSGPITEDPDYKKKFNNVEALLSGGLGHKVLNPAVLPAGMTEAQYMRIDLAMLDSADVVVFLPGWAESRGACLEWSYCRKTGKPHLYWDDWERSNVAERPQLLDEAIEEATSNGDN